jgi:hypothetical protein
MNGKVYYRESDICKQSTRVFNLQELDSNLYPLVAYCANPAVCRRELMAVSFGEACLEPCAGMCDNCARKYAAAACRPPLTVVSTLDCSALVSTLLLLVRAGEKDNKGYTLTQAVDLFSKRGSSLASLAKEKSIGYTAFPALVVQCLLKGLLKETFQHTAYATNSYLKLTARGHAFLDSAHDQTQFSFTLQMGEPVPFPLPAGDNSGATPPKTALSLDAKTLATAGSSSSSTSSMSSITHPLHVHNWVPQADSRPEVECNSSVDTDSDVESTAPRQQSEEALSKDRAAGVTTTHSQPTQTAQPPHSKVGLAAKSNLDVTSCRNRREESSNNALGPKRKQARSRDSFEQDDLWEDVCTKGSRGRVTQTKTRKKLRIVVSSDSEGVD